MLKALRVSHRARLSRPCRPAGAESETGLECRGRPYPGNDLHDGDSTAAQPGGERDV